MPRFCGSARQPAGAKKHHRRYCKFLEAGTACEWGCVAGEGGVIVCHKFVRGYCEYGESCKRGEHILQARRMPEANRSRSSRQRSRSRGSGFRPHIKDGPKETELKKHLAILGLSSKCEELQDHDAALITSTYRHLAAKRHPDKCRDMPDADERFKKLSAAKDYVLKMVPFSV